ncbi:pecanex-like protein 4 [Diadema antillarum]|uniref:pecanex-like protein 4 n=1 Tax=Diadema antillarum TaxID=105358 RepID=UPI003A84530D
MGTEVPLLNEYKLDFFWKRFPQTLLGGPKLKLSGSSVRYSAPAYVYIIQLTVFLLPWIIGGILTAVVEVGPLSAHVGYYIYGACMVVYVLAVQLTSLVVQRRATTVAAFHNTNVLAEEDEVDFDSCCGFETLKFALPTKRFKINIVLHALVSGPVCALGFWYLLPSTLQPLYGNVGATVILYIFGWLTLCVVQYPLTVASPPEPALFRAIDTLELLPLMRPFYALVCFLVHLAYKFYPSLLLTNQILHVVYIFLPMLWCMGTLPPLDALVLWLMEQALVHFLGGSQMAGDVRLCLMFLASLVVVVVAYFLPSVLVAIVFSACLGYILSLDLSSLANQILSSIQQSMKKQANHSPSHRAKTEAQSGPKVKKGLGWGWGWREFLINLIMLLGVGAVAGVCSNFSPSTCTSTSAVVRRALGYVVISLAVLVKVLGDLQMVYICFGMLRNKLFPDSINSSLKYSTRKRRLHRLGYVRRFLLDLVSPFIIVAYLGLRMEYSGLSLPSVWFAVGAVYSFRKVWQSTSTALLDVSVLHILEELSVCGSTSLAVWWPSDTGAQLIIIGLLHCWITQTLDKLYCYTTILITSYTLEKQRRKSSLPLIIISLIFFPVVLGIIAASSLLSAPLLPVFTLPILLIGFPRPLRMWPGVVGAAANVCEDSVYYQQLEQKLGGVLRRAAATGSLGNISPGSYLLLRFQDRMAWLQVLECGYGFCTISLKGMELQETSCHTVEAARLDDIFEAAFTHPKEKFPVCYLNQFPMHSLTPVDALPVDTYSDARNVLTGIIDSPTTLEMVDSCFIKTLTWLLLRHNSAKRKDFPTPSSSNSNSNFDGAKECGSVSSKMGLVQMKPLEKRGMSVSEDSGRAESVQSRPLSSHIKQQPKRKSLVGSWGSLDSWNDNDSLELEPIETKPKLTTRPNKNPSPPPSRKGDLTLPGALPDFSDEEDDILKELDFGLPAVDIHAPKKDKNKPGIPLAKQAINLSSSAQFSSPYSSKLSLPLKWREIPLDANLVTPLLQRFPLDWYKHVLAQLDIESQKTASELAAEIASDEALTSMYANLVMACYGMVNVFGLTGVSAVGAGANHVYKIYTGDIPWSINLDWLTEDKELHDIVLKAFRFAFKLAYDQTVLGEATDNDELVEYLQEYEDEWYIGKDSDDQWSEAVKMDKPKLFSLVYDANDNTYNGRVLSRQPVMVHIGKLNSEVVRSLWSSLSLELLYFTNDDEERYSIQAHPVVLRNLTIQAADPPLGYPIYASQPLSIPMW